MKKIFCIVLFLLCSLTISFANTTKTNKSKKSFEYLYTEALFIKSSEKYDTAINKLLQLEKYKLQLDRIYYQIADCYYYKLDFIKSEKYARKAIKINKNFSKPYILIFNIFNTLKYYEKSSDILSELLEYNPDLIQYQYYLGMLNTNTIKNYNLGAYVFNQILNISKKTPIPLYYLEQTHLSLFRIYFNQQNFKKCIFHLSKAVEFNSKHNVKFFQIANYFISNNLLKESAISLEKYLENIKSMPNSSTYLHKKVIGYLAKIYYITNNPKSSTFLYQSSDDSTAEGKLSRALFLEYIKKDQEAKTQLLKILKNFPKSIVANIAIAKIYKRENNLDLAYKYFLSAATLLYKTNLHEASIWNLLQALSIKPNQSKIYFILGQLYEKTDQFATAIYYFNKSYQLKPDIEILLHIAYLYSLNNNFEKSQNYFVKAINTDPKYARIYFFQGLVATKKYSHKSAEKFFSKAIELQDNEHSFYFYLALSQEKLSKFNDAILALENALKYDKNNASYSNYLGYLYADLNINIDKAIKLIKTALKEDPHNGAYLDSLGWAYYRKGKIDEALIYLLRAERNLKANNNPDPVVYDHLGDISLKKGDKNKAIYYWKKSLSYKNNPKIQKKINSILKAK